MIISNPAELVSYQEVAKLSTQILRELYEAVRPGVTPLELDQLAVELLKKNKARSAFKGVGGPDNPFPYTICVSVNEVVVHGVPNDRPFQKGDLIKVDFGLIKNDLITDHCFTLGLAPLAAADEKLIRAARKAVAKAASLAVVGNTVGDLGFAQESTVAKEGFNVATGFVGHGIGHTMHDDPQLPAFGRKGKGLRLIEGQVLCVESQVLAGEDDLEKAADNWSIVTKDGSKAAMFEVMVVVGKKKPLVLTPTLGWEISR